MKYRSTIAICIFFLFVSVQQTEVNAAAPVNLSTGTVVSNGSPGEIITSSGLQFSVTSQDNDSCSSEYESIAQAFDGNSGTKFCYKSWNRYSLPNEVVIHYLNASVNISSLGLSSANDADRRDPKSWQLFGSSDGNNWNLIASNTYSGANFDSLGRKADYENVSFVSSNSYSYIKFVVTDIRDLFLSSIADSGGPVVQYSELRLFGNVVLNCSYKGNSGNAKNDVGTSKSASAAVTNSKGAGACQNAASR